MIALGDSYETGSGVDVNLRTALSWYRKAAEAGNAGAAAKISGVESLLAESKQKKKEPLPRTLEVAEPQTPEEMLKLGMLYEEGKEVKQNLPEAFKQYLKAAEAGNTEAMWRLGDCYCEGKGVVRNDAEAVEWYNRAVKQRCAECLYRLGICYRKGEGVALDVNKAVEYFKMV